MITFGGKFEQCRVYARVTFSSSSLIYAIVRNGDYSGQDEFHSLRVVR